MTNAIQLELSSRTGMVWQSDIGDEYYAFYPGSFRVWYYYPLYNSLKLVSATASQVFTKHILRHKGLVIRPDVACWQFAPRQEKEWTVKTINAATKKIAERRGAIRKIRATEASLAWYCDTAALFLPYLKRLSLASVDTDPRIPDLTFLCPGGHLSMSLRGVVRLSLSFDDSRQDRLAELVPETCRVMAGEPMRIGININDCRGKMGIQTYHNGPPTEVLASLEKFISTPIGRFAIVNLNERLQKEIENGE